MVKQIAIIFTAMLLIACALVEETEKSTPPALNNIEFRNAAESRISWRDPGTTADTSSGKWVRAKILGFNDFHGNLNPRLIDGRPVGSAAVLAAYLDTEISEADGRAIIVHSGDMVGASPPESALLHDEPSIQFLNMLANEYCTAGELTNPLCNLVGTLGNHEFDEGPAELLRLHYGGDHADSTSMADNWGGAVFPYVSANVIDRNSGKTLLPPYVIKEIAGISVAFIGAVTKTTPQITVVSGVIGIEFLDEAAAINSYVQELKKQNVRAIVVNIHEGLDQTSMGASATVGERDLQGRIIDIVTALDAEIDIVISGHSHGYTNLLVPAAGSRQILLTQAFSYGTAYSDIDITLDPKSGDIVEKSAAIITTWADRGPGRSPDSEVAGFVAQVNLAVEPLVSRVVGVSATALSRDKNNAGESLLGNLAADAMHAAMAVDIAFMGSSFQGGIDVGDILWGELFTMMPFGNNLVAMTLTGEQLIRLLNQQFADRRYSYFLQVAGLSYTWDASRPEHDRVVEVLDSSGTPLNLQTRYRICVPNFFASGGESFDVFTEGTDRVAGPLVLDAAVEYIRAMPQPVRTPTGGRITRLN